MCYRHGRIRQIDTGKSKGYSGGMLTGRVPFFIFVLMVCLALASLAQQETMVHGLRGSISIVPDLSGETEIRIELERGPAGGLSGVQRFVAQFEKDAPAPKAWKGEARVFYGDRFVAVLGEDGTRVMYKLPEEPMPPSLNRFGFKPLAAYGIAVYKKVQPATNLHR